MMRLSFAAVLSAVCSAALGCSSSSAGGTATTTASAGSTASSGSTGSSTTSGTTGSSSSSTSSGSGSASASTSGSGTSGSGSGNTSSGSSTSTTGGCQSNAACGSGQTCDADYGACCPGLGGTDFYVDGVVPFEAACCGTSKADPCGSITHMMDLLGAAGLHGVTINAYNSDFSSDWVPSLGNVQERWPIHLGLGVTLRAPGVYFAPPVRGQTAFLIAPFGAGDTAQVAIAGSGPAANQQVYLGTALSGLAVANCRIAVEDGHDPDAGGALPLALSAVTMTSSAVGLDVAAGAQVTLGPGPVTIQLLSTAFGFDQTGFPGILGPIGLACQGAGSSVRDLPDAGDGGILTVWSSGTQVSIDDGCSASLTAGPNLAFGANQVFCSSQVGLRVAGNSELTFGSAAVPGFIACANAEDLDMETTASGAPSVTVAGAALQHGCVGAYVNGGSFRSVASQYEANYVGMVVNGTATSVVLSGDGGAATANVLACNAYGEENSCNLDGFSTPNQALGGLGILNLTTAVTVDARNSVWDHWANGQADQWVCADDTYQSCTCTGPSCPPSNVPLPVTETPGNNNPSPVDALWLETFTPATPGTPAIDTSAGSQNRNACPQ